MQACNEQSEATLDDQSARLVARVLLDVAHKLGDVEIPDRSRLIDDEQAAPLLSMPVRRFRRLVKQTDDLPRVTLPNGDVRFDAVQLMAWAREQNGENPTTETGENE